MAVDGDHWTDSMRADDTVAFFTGETPLINYNELVNQLVYLLLPVGWRLVNSAGSWWSWLILSACSLSFLAESWLMAGNDAPWLMIMVADHGCLLIS